MAIIRKRAKKAGRGLDAPASAPSVTRRTVQVNGTLHRTSTDWGLSPELLKAWNPGSFFDDGQYVFIDPPEVSR